MVLPRPRSRAPQNTRENRRGYSTSRRRKRALLSRSRFRTVSGIDWSHMIDPSREKIMRSCYRSCPLMEAILGAQNSFFFVRVKTEEKQSEADTRAAASLEALEVRFRFPLSHLGATSCGLFPETVRRLSLCFLSGCRADIMPSRRATCKCAVDLYSCQQTPLRTKPHRDE